MVWRGPKPPWSIPNRRQPNAEAAVNSGQTMCICTSILECRPAINALRPRLGVGRGMRSGMKEDTVRPASGQRETGTREAARLQDSAVRKTRLGPGSTEANCGEREYDRPAGHPQNGPVKLDAALRRSRRTACIEAATQPRDGCAAGLRNGRVLGALRPGCPRGRSAVCASTSANVSRHP